MRRKHRETYEPSLLSYYRKKNDRFLFNIDEEKNGRFWQELKEKKIVCANTANQKMNSRAYLPRFIFWTKQFYDLFYSSDISLKTNHFASYTFLERIRGTKKNGKAIKFWGEHKNIYWNSGKIEEYDVEGIAAPPCELFVSKDVKAYQIEIFCNEYLFNRNLERAIEKDLNLLFSENKKELFDKHDSKVGAYLKTNFSEKAFERYGFIPYQDLDYLKMINWIADPLIELSKVVHHLEPESWRSYAKIKAEDRNIHPYTFHQLDLVSLLEKFLRTTGKDILKEVGKQQSFILDKLQKIIKGENVILHFEELLGVAKRKSRKKEVYAVSESILELAKKGKNFSYAPPKSTKLRVFDTRLVIKEKQKAIAEIQQICESILEAYKQNKLS